MEKSERAQFKILWSSYIFKSWDTLISLFVQSTSLVILYLFFEKFIESKINTYWVSRALSQVSIDSLDRILILLLIIEIIYAYYQIRAKNFTLKPIEIFIVFFYSKYRFYDYQWQFYPYGWYVNFFDTIPILILFSKGISIWSFYYSLRDSSLKTGIIDPDLPLSDSNPVDELKRENFANELVVVLKETKPSERALVIGINGTWGSGKSSLQYMISKKMRKKENASSFYEVNFNPWLYSKEKSLAYSFLNAVKQTLRAEQYIISSTINSYAVTLLHSTENILLSTRFFKDLKNEPSLENELKNVKSRIKNLKRTLVVIIDDLDRLSDEELIEVFRLVRLIGDFPNTIYIILYDKEYVKEAIKSKLNEHNADIFIDKIIQVEYTIPESSVENVRVLFLKHLRRSVEQAVPESKKLWNEEKINSLIKLGIFNDCIRNVRDIKRFTNNFLLRYKSIYAHVNLYQFILIELVRYKYPAFITLLFWHKELFIREINGKNPFTLPDIPLAPTPFWDALQRNAELRTVLIRMADFNNEENSISEPFNFLNYFTLTLQEDFISDQEFTETITKPSEEGRVKFMRWHTTNPDMLIYRFRNFDAFKEISDFMLFLEQLIFVDNLMSGKESWDKLPQIFIDKYLNLVSSKKFDENEFYHEVSKRLLGDRTGITTPLRNIFRNNSSFSINGAYTDSPLLHGWKVQKGIDNMSYFFTAESDSENVRHIVFDAPHEFLFEYDFEYGFFLRDVSCEFKLFKRGSGFFYIKLQVKKGDDVKNILIQPSEQPSSSLGKVWDNEYIIGLNVSIIKDWRLFEFNVENAFKTNTELVLEGYQFHAITGIAIRGKVGFGKFVLF
ncbi:MAG TPA: P-loop NTPase fold protein [Cyclobacteriaceae bacterium]